MSEHRHVLQLTHRVDQAVALSCFELDGHGEKACAEARDAGYREGFEKAARSAREQAEGDRQRWGNALQNVIESLSAQEETLAAQIRPAILDLVIKGVRRVVEGYEPDRETVAKIVSATIDNYPREEANLSVRLHPEDYQLVHDLTHRWSANLPGFQLQPDTSLIRGDCLVSGRFGLTDARLETKLDNLRTSLASPHA